MKQRFAQRQQVNMSTDIIAASSLILKQQFGAVVSQVGVYLMQKGGTPVTFIVHDTGMGISKVSG